MKWEQLLGAGPVKTDRLNFRLCLVQAGVSIARAFRALEWKLRLGGPGVRPPKNALRKNYRAVITRQCLINCTRVPRIINDPKVPRFVRVLCGGNQARYGLRYVDVSACTV